MAKKAKKKATSKRRIVKRTTARRTTLRSTKGKKLYAVRDAGGKFKDIQTYQRAHSQDIRRQAEAEGDASATNEATGPDKA